MVVCSQQIVLPAQEEHEQDVRGVLESHLAGCDFPGRMVRTGGICDRITKGNVRYTPIRHRLRASNSRLISVPAIERGSSPVLGARHARCSGSCAVSDSCSYPYP